MARKKKVASVKKRPVRRTRGDGLNNAYNVVTADNDNLARAMASLVPEDRRGTSRYLDIVQWNLEWFGAQKSVEKDRQRFAQVVDLLEALNGDLFVLQEIAGPSYDGRYPGSLDAVAAELTRRGAGDYTVFYTRAGGEQRVAMMWDSTWLRAKSDVVDLFPQGTYKTATGKDAFATRTPLHGYFSARVPPEAVARPGGSADKFDFQVLGVHLKAMAEGFEQRLASAEVLAKWLTTEAPLTDSDALIMGDWNAPPADPSWAPFHALERGPDAKVKFTEINDPSDFSYLWLANRSTQFTSRIDLTAMSLASATKVVGEAARVVRWKPIEDAIAQAGSMTDKQVVAVMRQLKDSISDHLPTVTRFYFTE